MIKFLLCFPKTVQLSFINSYLTAQNKQSKIVYPGFEIHVELLFLVEFSQVLLLIPPSDCLFSTDVSMCVPQRLFKKAFALVWLLNGFSHNFEKGDGLLSIDNTWYLIIEFYLFNKHKTFFLLKKQTYMCLTHGRLQLLFLLAKHASKHTATMLVNVIFLHTALISWRILFLVHTYMCVCVFQSISLFVGNTIEMHVFDTWQFAIHCFC